jgi:hypothetical protein
MKKTNSKAYVIISAALLYLFSLNGLSAADYLDPCSGNKNQNCCIHYTFLPQQITQVNSSCRISSCGWDLTATSNQCVSVCETNPKEDDCQLAKTQAHCEHHKPGKGAHNLCGGADKTDGCHWLITKAKPNGYCSVDCN